MPDQAAAGTGVSATEILATGSRLGKTVKAADCEVWATEAMGSVRVFMQRKRLPEPFRPAQDGTK
jgi:hypothetical protein